MGIFSFFSKDKKETLDKGLSKTKESVFSKITKAIAGKSKVDDDVLDNLEEVLITSDVGVDTTLKIIDRIEKRVARDKYVTTQELTTLLRDEIASLLTENNTEDAEGFALPEGKKPYVIMVVGVNGVGKTTTIGKLAYQFKKAGKKVYLGAADTFRAAAVEQLVIWSERVGVPIVKQNMGSDPASVAFDTLSSDQLDERAYQDQERDEKGDSGRSPRDLVGTGRLYRAERFRASQTIYRRHRGERLGRDQAGRYRQGGCRDRYLRPFPYPREIYRTRRGDGGFASIPQT